MVFKVTVGHTIEVNKILGIPVMKPDGLILDVTYDIMIPGLLNNKQVKVVFKNTSRCDPNIEHDPTVESMALAIKAPPCVTLDEADKDINIINTMSTTRTVSESKIVLHKESDGECTRNVGIATNVGFMDPLKVADVLANLSLKKKYVKSMNETNSSTLYSIFG